MQSSKYINKVLFSTFIIIISQTIKASAIETKCGKYIYQVEILSGADEFEKRFELYYKKNNKKILFYKTESGIQLITACIQNKRKESLMLFQEFCGGNGCPEDMYGIYNPNIKKMIIKPSDYPEGNYEQVKKIIGYSLPSLVYDKRNFCCDKNQY